MTNNEILTYLEKNPKTFCWLNLGVGLVRLANGEGLILLRVMIASKDTPRWIYTGPTKVEAKTAEVYFNNDEPRKSFTFGW